MTQDRGRVARCAGRIDRRAEVAGRSQRAGQRRLLDGIPGRRGVVAVLGLAVAFVASCGVDTKEFRQSAADDGSSTSGGSAGIPARPVGDGGTVQPVGFSTQPPADTADDAPSPRNVSFGEAELVFRAGDYEDAADLFEAYALRRPENPWGHYMLGISAWRAGDHARAGAALERTVEVDPKHGKGLLNLARVLLEQRQASDALDYVEQVVELAPESGEGWRVLGNARAELGMVGEAVAAYRTALVLDHRDAWTMNNLGLLLIRDGRYEEALPPLARATELRPDVAVFQNNLGIALERCGYLAEATEAFRAALYANPDHERAQVSLERVSPRVSADPPAALDLSELAGAFADEVQHWVENGVDPSAAESTGFVRMSEPGC